MAAIWPATTRRCYIDWFDDGVSARSFVQRALAFGRQTQLLGKLDLDSQIAVAHLLATVHTGAAAVLAESGGISPVAFDSFIECFRHIFTARYAEHNTRLARLRSAIQTCEGTRDDIRRIEAKLLENAELLKAAESDSSMKLKELLLAAAAAA